VAQLALELFGLPLEPARHPRLETVIVPGRIRTPLGAIPIHRAMAAPMLLDQGKYDESYDYES
jgi:hypothetical protein